ncbi:MAG: hypothetical protein LQ349_004199 [Xanthoria aureola]|nr:MAG: hypothetical protein LQ349_004199 [Xanthoria aureola]
MLLWVLCLKLWWLALPLSTLQHPSKPQGQTAEQELEPRDAAITSNMANANLAMTLDPKVMASGSVVLTAAGQVPQDGSVPLLYRLNPLLLNYNYTGILVNQSSNNPFSYRGRDPYPAGPYPPPGRAPYPPDPYPPGPDPYPPGPDPYPPGPDPFSPSDPNEIKGEINLKTSDCLLDTTILGYPLETLKGNMDDGVYIKVDIAVAKGYLDIYIEDGNPKDEVWLLADLHLPLRQHFYKKIHMFNIPHRPGPPRPHRPLREHPWPLPSNLPATS